MLFRSAKTRFLAAIAYQTFRSMDPNAPGLNPFAPHVTEEINELMGGDMLAVSPWPTYDEAKCVDAEVEIVAQVNGKVRAKLSVPADIEAADAIALAKADAKISEEISGKTIVKELYVKGRLVNIVVK